IARTTIDRIVNEFEDRGWAERTPDGGYRATPTGEQVVTEFTPLVESMEAIRTLGDLVAWLPTDDVPIDLRHFKDATVMRPDPADPTSTVSHLTELLRGASEFHCIVGVAPPLAFEKSMRDGVVSGELTTEHVITDEEYRYLLEVRDRVARWREYIEAGANLYLHDGPVPCNLFVFDDTVIIAHSQGEVGDPLVGIESTDETVRSWALEVISTYRTNSERLKTASF
ncbi:MAG: hypothetical protein R3324_10200, partial [Halobacteriales archaeon]|nr:hypothetical protein [Halobacteriales archaeon]